MTIAIDFGTSNTVVARWNAATQQPETLALPGFSILQAQNPPLIPSLVYVEDASQREVLLGQLVRDRGLDITHDPRFFRNFKRGIGAEIQGFLPELDGHLVTFDRVGEWFLSRIVQSVREVPLPVESLVFTVPVDSFETYRNWLGKVSQSLQVEQVRMLDEPTAAALGYGIAEGELLLVVDFGGGTLDLSLVRLDQSSQNASKPLGFILQWGKKSLAERSGQRPRIARVLAKAGQTLGGSDIDHWLVDYFGQTQGVAASPLMNRLAEKLKIQLSLQPQASEVYFNDETFESYDLSLDREQFEAILREHQFFDRLDDNMTQVLQQARRQGIEVSDINAVLLVGGTAQIPAVQTWVRQYFEESKIRSSKPFEAIAHGALQITQGIELKDFLYHSYGIRYWDRRQNRHNWHPLIKAGQAYPMSDPVELVLGASVDNQPNIELILGELGAETGGTEVYFDGNRLVTRSLASGQTTVQTLNDRDGARTIAQLDPPGFPGRDRIKVQFRVDEQRFLRMTVEDLLTNQTLLKDRSVVQLS
ncbi:MAG: Hsp70 family protein [Leptolyngbyaceae cyanobacterium bins.59]|nr:Hsp70 family protein [Leptolyngbyaceae cyanobacterium bins.59]